MKIITKLLLLSILALTGCTQTNTEKVEVPIEVERIVEVPATQLKVGTENNANGTSDGGGGDIDYSTPEQIKAAVKKVHFLVANPYFVTSILDFLEIDIDRLNLDKDQYRRIIEKTNVSDLEPNAFYRLKISVFIFQNNRLFDSQNLHPLASTKINFEEDRACPAGNTKHADASVSEFSLNAEICFSLFTLQRIPPESLEAYVFGLWMHEIYHMLGNKDEDLALVIEKVMAMSYAQTPTSPWLTRFMNYQNSVIDLEQIQKEISNSLENESNDSFKKKKDFYFKLGKAHTNLEGIYNDLLLQKKPLVNNDSNKYDDLIKLIEDSIAGLEQLNSTPDPDIFKEKGFELTKKIREQIPLISHQFLLLGLY